MKNSCKKILKSVYEHYQNNGNPLYIDLDEETDYQSSILQNDISALLSNGYLLEDVPLSDGYLLTITEKGINFMENDIRPKEENQKSNINIQNSTITNLQGASFSNSNAVVGDNNYVSNNDLPFEELASLINEKPSADQAELQELLQTLERFQETGKPLHPGIFARFSDLVKKHTDLIIPIGKGLFRIFFTTQ